jgi:hypothetical protein
MYTFNDDFIGYPKNRKHEMFTGNDSLEKYNESLNVMPEDWYYKNNPIEYHRNNLGHRCKDIEEIDLTNYFLVAGCSHTDGIGLHLEDTYPYLLSKELGCDYYNLSLGGSGIDVLSYNLLTWVAKIKQKPKFLILQIPNIIRYCTVEEQINVHGSWAEQADKNEFLILGGQIKYFSSQQTLFRKLIKNHINVPIIDIFADISSISEINDPELSVRAYGIDLARDRMHMGKSSNKNIANKVLEKVQKFI